MEEELVREMELGSIEKVQQAIDALKRGEMIIIIDDASRENEGDLVMPAELITPEDTNFMIRHAGGLICAPLLPKDAERLNLTPMVVNNEDPYQTAFTVSVDHKSLHTGISAAERAVTLNELANENAVGDDFNRPGHIFPLIAREGGVLERRGHTEASVDIVSLAGFKPVAVICEILKEDGEMAREKDLIPYAKRHGLLLISIQDIVNYRLAKENQSELLPLSSAFLPTRHGDFTIYTFPNKNGGEPHVALVNRHRNFNVPATVRIHSECLTGDVFSSLKCDCHDQLNYGLEESAKAENGILLYLRQEGRGIGLVEKLKAYKLQEEGLDTIAANEALGHQPDSRTYEEAAAMLHHFGVKELHLLSNNPEKLAAMKLAGFKVIEEGTPRFETEENRDYLELKRNKMGHHL